MRRFVSCQLQYLSIFSHLSHHKSVSLGNDEPPTKRLKFKQRTRVSHFGAGLTNSSFMMDGRLINTDVDSMMAETAADVVRLGLTHIWPYRRVEPVCTGFATLGS
jgi:hypothetical protein